MKSIAYSTALTALALAASSFWLATKTARQQTYLFNLATDYSDHRLEHSYTLLISTNLVYRNCPCGFCDPIRGTAVPEHINSIGHDLIYQVSTNYLPLITK